jgi:hypothetical protein
MHPTATATTTVVQPVFVKNGAVLHKPTPATTKELLLRHSKGILKLKKKELRRSNNRNEYNLK